MKKYIPILLVVGVLAIVALFWKTSTNKPAQEGEVVPQNLSTSVPSATITPMTTPSNITPIAEKVNVTLKTNMGDIGKNTGGRIMFDNCFC